MSLTELRKEIDALDVVLQVAKYKKMKGIALKQSERERQLIEEKKKQGRELSLRKKFVEKIYRVIIDEALELEEET